jgi:hypothetical protein
MIADVTEVGETTPFEEIVRLLEQLRVTQRPMVDEAARRCCAEDSLLLALEYYTWLLAG